MLELPSAALLYGCIQVRKTLPLGTTAKEICGCLKLCKHLRSVSGAVTQMGKRL